MLEAIIRDCCSRTPTLRGAASVKLLSLNAQEPLSGILFNYTLRYSDAQDNTLSEELLPVFVTADGDVELERAKEFLRMHGELIETPRDNPQVVELVAALEELESLAQKAAAKVAQENFERVQHERNHQADACLEGLDRFQQAKRRRLQQSLGGFQLRLFEGEEMDIAIRRAQYELDRLDEQCESRRCLIEGRSHVQVNTPVLINLSVLVGKS